jgi:hypothetical protein
VRSAEAAGVSGNSSLFRQVRSARLAGDGYRVFRGMDR